MHTSTDVSGITYINFPHNIPHKGFILADPLSQKTDAVSQLIFDGNDDFGNMIHRRILGSFCPENIEEITQILAYAYQEKIPVSCKGHGHSTYGQAQVDGGIVINLVNFNKVHKVVENTITVEAGALWKDVVRNTLEKGLTPAVLTDYLGLSVGGVLQIGGLGGQTHQKGLVADNIESLKVVTMDGKISTSSRNENPDLFYASLTSLGQFTIILEATIKLEKAPENCQTSLLFYTDLATFFADQTALVEKKCCQYLEGQVIKYGLNPITDTNVPAQTDWYYMIEAVTYDDHPALNKDELHPIATQTEKESFSDFIFRMKQGVAFLKKDGSWYQQHPWINVLLPHNTAFKVVSEVMESLTLEDTGGWPVLFYPIDRSKLTCPNFKTPDSETIWAFSILRNAKDQQTAEQLLQKNRALYDKVVEQGGVMYPHGSIPLTHEDWKKHFGAHWKAFKAVKKDLDPLSLLGLGQGIFKRFHV